MENLEELKREELIGVNGGCFAFDAGWFIRWGGGAAYTNPRAIAAYIQHYALDKSECR